MFIIYYDSGTTNTRAYLIKDGKILQRMERQIGAKNSALKKDNTILLQELYHMYGELMAQVNITDADVAHIYMSGMISSPSGIVEIEHLPVPVDKDKLMNATARYQENRYFKRTLEIIPGIKTLQYGEMACPETACNVNIMRGEEIEIFGILKVNPKLAKGRCILVLPGSHTQAVFIEEGWITNLSSNITGELYKAIDKETILGASIDGDEPWEIDASMVCLGYKNAHTYGFNRALYILRVLDLFTEATLNQRRFYMEGVLNAGVMDAVAEAVGEGTFQFAVAGDEVQYQVYRAFCQNIYPRFRLVDVKTDKDTPFSVNGLLSLLQI